VSTENLWRRTVTVARRLTGRTPRRGPASPSIVLLSTSSETVMTTLVTLLSSRSSAVERLEAINDGRLEGAVAAILLAEMVSGLLADQSIRNAASYHESLAQLMGAVRQRIWRDEHGMM
jgi:hypothetical protein